MLTSGLSTAELLLIVQAINHRPSGMTVEATLETVSEFERDYVVACLELLPVRLHERDLLRRLIRKLSADHYQIQRDAACPHLRTRRLQNGNEVCLDCNLQITAY